VSPKGEGYSLAIDFSNALATIAPLGLSLSLTPGVYSVDLTPMANGQWKVLFGSDISVSAKANNQTNNIKIANLHGAGVFDPSLPGFVSQSWDSPKVESQSSGASGPGGTLTTETSYTGLHYESNGAAKSPGVETATFSETVGPFSQRIIQTPPTSGAPNATAPKPTVSIDVGAEATKANATLDGLRNRALSDLWVFMVAHNSADKLRNAQADLKSLLRAAIPVFDHIDGDVGLTSLSVTSTAGVFKSGEVSFKLGMNGVTEKGALSQSLAMKDVVWPADRMPAWLVPLASTEFALGVSVAGFNPDRAAETLIDNLDLEKTPSLPPSISASLLEKALPDGAVDVTLSTLHVRAPAFELTGDGAANVGVGRMPAGRATLRLKGLDDVQKALTEGAKTNASAAQALGGLNFARAMGKPGPDGTLQWEIAYGPDGLTINGMRLGGPSAAPKK